MKLFVANIDRSVTETQLFRIFSAFGEVTSVSISTDLATGEVKEFGFVEMFAEAEAQQAMESIHEKLVNGRRLSVVQAKPASKP